jgi:hypothetical protein
LLLLFASHGPIKFPGPARLRETRRPAEPNGAGAARRLLQSRRAALLPLPVKRGLCSMRGPHLGKPLPNRQNFQGVAAPATNGRSAPEHGPVRAEAQLVQPQLEVLENIIVLFTFKKIIDSVYCTVYSMLAYKS